ncbi:ABC transporter permease subunit [Adhaeribacter radiodurans]|uniref:ABC transporter permease subunit n=1 Tax=Adhaeribacter radiodurans TaxID=2745197 RepID=A0A7L7LAS9_9BACT|nr:ABC transporter permease subunit [Adhaeribacter radiodurans]QMU29938.1 ABC transporter permease subunit [Adhaeribacter radiodurans]
MSRTKKTTGLYWRFLFLLLAVLPVAGGLVYGLANSFGLTGVLSTGFTLEHWHQVLSSSALLDSLAYSIYIALVASSLATVLALFLALYFKKSLHRGALSYLLFLPLTIPAMIMGFLIFELLTKSGLLSRIVYQAGWLIDLQNFPSLVHDSWGFGIILAHVCMEVPFLTLLFHAIYQEQELHLLKAVSENLGAEKFYFLRHVAFPILLKTAAPNLMLYFIFILGSYEIPLLIGSQQHQMVAVLAVQKFQRFNLLDIPQGYAISVAFTGLVLLLLLLFFKNVSRHV